MKERVPFWLCLVFIALSLTVCKDDSDDDDSNGLMYQLINGGTAYSVIGYDRRASTVIIPAIYKGLFVTAIGDYAFKGYTGLAIIIPASVTSIGNFAFNDCSDLASITIPASVTSIGNAAFRDCNSLTSLTLSEGVASIGEYAFDHCISLASITIPASVTSIGRNAFYQWTVSQTIYIQGYTSEAAADLVYDPSWRSTNGATFEYQGS